MKPLQRKLWAAGNKTMSALYRRTNGRIGGRARGGTPVLLLTVRGRKTGVERTAPVSYFEHEGGYLVVGSAGGIAEDPQWFKNLAATDMARIRVKAEESTVNVRVLEGTERDAAWTRVVLAEAPSFADYERKSGRVLPIARLTPTG
ncbi:MAG: nitroreductase family deazaflavin-dependent oxidoreductase [Aldersonia sp.]|nr:nitroreductase family deazaflavin-dependent oxidoreductase [Aldersonia sp.]